MECLNFLIQVVWLVKVLHQNWKTDGLNPTEYLAEQRDTTLLGGSWWPSGWKQN